MSVVVFTGPTLSAREGRSLLEATYRPPASQGDVYAAACQRPWAIGIIDGYFERVPAVWHKEILWALSKGVRVYGASSMGALRAAELDALGMRGVGEVYGLIARGEIEDDDEVAMIHGNEDDDYPAFSEPLVNLRYTFAAARAQGIVSDATHQDLLAVAKALFYPDRTIDRIVGRARLAGSAAEELDALAAWFPAGRVDQKRLDARAMLRRMGADRMEEGSEPLRVAFRFQHTDAWDQVRRQIDRRMLNEREREHGAAYPHDAVLDELRLEPGLHADIRREALVRAMAAELAERDGGSVAESVIARAANDFRIGHSLEDADSVARWLDEQSLSAAALADLLADRAKGLRVRDVFEADLDRAVGDVLALSGEHRRLADRARAKQRHLAERGLDNPTMGEAGIDEAALWSWYFEARLGEQVPADLAAASQRSSFPDVASMRRTVLREYCYVTTVGAGPDDADRR